MKTLEQAPPVSAVVADHQLTEALQKYARVQRELGNEHLVAWALETIRGLDPNTAAKDKAKAVAAKTEVLSALMTYTTTAMLQGRTAQAIALNDAIIKLQEDNYVSFRQATKQLEQSLSSRIDAVVASIPKKK